MKKTVHVFLAIWIAALLLPIGAWFAEKTTPFVKFKPFPLKSEKRNPTPRPTLLDDPQRHVSPAGFGRALEEWYSDSFPWRTELIAFHRDFSFHRLKSPIGRDVPGYGNWIFRRGGDWAELDDYLGAFELTDAELADWVTLFEGRHEWALAIGTHFINLPSPVKAQARPQMLFPAIRNHRGRNVSAQVEAALANSPARDNVIFAAPAFNAAVEAGRETFFDSDHHPSAYGLWLLYDALNRRLAELFPNQVKGPMPWFDDPPQAVREGREFGCWLEDKEPRYRMDVSAPGEVEDGDGVPPAYQRYPYCCISTVREGGGISIVMAHDSYMRFSLASWRRKREFARLPFAPGVGRARAWIFCRAPPSFLLDITQDAVPDVIIEQFPECRLDGSAHVLLSPSLRAAALFAHGRPLPTSLPAPPGGAHIVARVVLDGLEQDGDATPVVRLLLSGQTIAEASVRSGVKRAVFIDIHDFPDNSGNDRVEVSITGGHASNAELSLREIDEPADKP